MACMVYSRSMSRLDEYRAKAEYCREMAAKVISPLDKDAWLQEATNWRTLASLSDWEHPAAAEMNVDEIMGNARLTPIKGNR